MGLLTFEGLKYSGETLGETCHGGCYSKNGKTSFRRSSSSRTFTLHFICLRGLIFEISRHAWFGERIALKGRLGKEADRFGFQHQ